MRGVLSAGSLLAVDLLGFRDCFDVVYAVSAGSVNAAYFLAGQGTEGITVYFDDINSRRFINPWRLWKIVDVDFVYDDLVLNVKPLNEEYILKARQQFYVTATDVDTGENVLLDTKTGDASISRFLKASSALPVLYNRRVTIGGRHYMDGGASGGLPIYRAIEHGCTDLLVLLSREADYISKGPRLFDKLAFRLLAGFRYPAMYSSFLKAVEHKELNRKLASGAAESVGVNVATVCPDTEESSVGRTTIDRSVLIRGAYLLARKVYRVFGEEKSPLDRLFDNFGDRSAS
jgi:predicted patatin/cPLA2 family phospholipase